MPPNRLDHIEALGHRRPARPESATFFARGGLPSGVAERSSFPGQWYGWAGDHGRANAEEQLRRWMLAWTAGGEEWFSGLLEPGPAPPRGSDCIRGNRLSSGRAHPPLQSPQTDDGKCGRYRISPGRYSHQEDVG